MNSNRRLSAYYRMDLNTKVTKTNLPIKVCLTAAAVLMFAMLGFVMYTGSAVLYIHFWVYIAVASLIVLLLLSAGAYAIYNRFNTERSRRNAAIILSGAVLMVGVTAFTFCSLFMNMWQPMGFFDSPEGENRIVVMRSQADDGVIIEAYPAIGNHFYVAGLESEKVLSNGIVSGVEWEGERLAKVKLEDINGVDTELTVDFAILYAGETEAAE